MPIPAYVKIRPEDKEAVEKLLAANPEMFNAPDNAKIAELQGQIDQMLGDYTDWKKWHDEAYPLAQAWEAENVKMKAELAELREARKKGADAQAEAEAAKKALEAAKAAGNGNGAASPSYEELASKLQAGFISKEEFTAALKQVREETLAEAGKTFWEKMYPEISSTLLGVTEASARFSQEFPKETWSRQDFLKFAKENKFSSVDKAYDAYVADRRHKAEVDSAVAKALTEERARVAQQSIPGAAPARPQDLGILERRALNVKPEFETPENARFGSGQLAALAAAELRKEGKTGGLNNQRGLPE